MSYVQLNSFDAGLLAGFVGFISFKELRDGRIGEIPGDKGQFGVYAVVRASEEPPLFLVQGTCGDFRGAPYPVQKLRAKWVPSTRILYFGKAGGPGEGGAGRNETLQSRIQDYSSYGLGRNVGHGGGRAIWQLSDSESLLVCWRRTVEEVPLHAEKALRARFHHDYKRLPFANWKR